MEVVPISAQQHMHISDATDRIRALVEQMVNQAESEQQKSSVSSGQQLIILRDPNQQKPRRLSRHQKREQELRRARAQIQASTSGG
jgi:predicted GTPase